MTCGYILSDVTTRGTSKLQAIEVSDYSRTGSNQSPEAREHNGIESSGSESTSAGTARYEGACRLLADGVDIRIIQLMLGHASIQQTQRYLNVTDEELRRGLKVSWNNKGRPLRVLSA